MPVLGDTLSSSSIALADLSDVPTSATPQIGRLGIGTPAGSTARITLPATASLAGGIDFGGTASLQYVSAGKVKFERPSGGSSTLEVNAATGQDSILDISENGTSQWRVYHTAGNSRLNIRDQGAGSAARTLMWFSPVGPVVFGATPNTGQPAVKFTADAGLDAGSAAGSLVRAVLDQTSFTGGTNGTVGDSLSTGSVITTGASFFFGLSSTQTFDTKGSLISVNVNHTLNKPAGMTYPDTRNETSAIYSRVTCNNEGGYAAALELRTQINDAGAGAEADAGPAKAFGAIIALHEDNAYADYNNTTSFGAGSTWLDTGQRGIQILSAGTSPVGTGLLISGASGFTRALVIQNTSVADVFVVDGSGNLGLGVTRNQASSAVLPAKIVFATDTTAAGGIQFGTTGAASLYRSNAGTLRTDTALSVGEFLNMTGSTTSGYIRMTANSGTVTTPPNTGNAHIYIKNGRFIVAYNQAGTVKYHYRDLTATADGSWVYSATAP